LADKYLYYQNKVREIKLKKKEDLDDVVYLTESNTEKTVEGKVMDELGLKKMCCRRHVLTHVDIL